MTVAAGGCFSFSQNHRASVNTVAAHRRCQRCQFRQWPHLI